MAALLVVRHGRTTANAEGRLLGRSDLPLDDVGVEQAAATGAAVAAWAGRRRPLVVSSPLLRTRQTATAIAGAVGATEEIEGQAEIDVQAEIEVQLDERLVELDYGALDGTPTADIAPSMWAAWQADLAFRPPGGESLAELGRRARDACEDWSQRSTSDRPIVFVSHVSPIKAAVAWALGVGDEISWRTRLDTASISEIVVRAGRPVLVRFNDTAHLQRPATPLR